MKIYQNLKDVTEARHFLGGKKREQKIKQEKIQSQKFGKRREN